MGGAAGVAAPVSAAIVGLGLSGINAAQAQGVYSANPNPCTEYARNVSLASLAASTWAAVGAGIGSGGGAAPRAPQPQLVFAGVGLTSGAAQAGGIITGVGQAGGIVAGIGGGITIADNSGEGEGAGDVIIEGQSDDPAREIPQALRFGRIYGGGIFRFLGNSQEGIEGFFTPNGGLPEFPVSLKKHTDTGRMANLISRINVNANHVTNAGYAGRTVYHADVSQFSSTALRDFIQNGPIGNMPAEGVFSALFFEGTDGLVRVELNNIQVTGIP